MGKRRGGLVSEKKENAPVGASVQKSFRVQQVKGEGEGR